MEPTELALLEEKYPLLTPKELTAYVSFAEMKQPVIAETKANELYELFLRGRSLQEIVRQNRGFNLGQLVQARIERKWDERRKAYLEDLANQVHSRVEIAKAETATLLADLLSVSREVMADKINRYFQTKNPDEISDLPVHSLSQLKTLQTMLLELTAPKKEPGASPVTVNVSQPRHEPKPVETVEGKASAATEASDFLVRLSNGAK